MELTSFENDILPEQLCNALQEDGAAIVEGLLDDVQLSKLRAEADAAFNQSGQLTFSEGDGSKVKFFGALPVSAPSAIDNIILNDLLTSVADQLLGPNGHSYRIQASGGLMAVPGGSRQPLHRELDIYKPYITFGPEHPEYIVFSIWALDDFFKENGATVLVPGSHKWPEDRVPSEEELRYAEMPAGSAAFWLGRTIHGGGANSTDTVRRAMITGFSVDWLTQEENLYVGIPQETARTFPKRLQQLLGYDACPTYNWSWGRKNQNTLEFVDDPSQTGPGADGANIEATIAVQG